MDVGGKIKLAASRVGENVAFHVPLMSVRRPAAVSKAIGLDVRGFKHSISNQAIVHIRNEHPGLDAADFARLPQVLKSGSFRKAPHGGVNGVPRVIYRQRVDGVLYEWVGEPRSRKGRIDTVTFYRVT